MALTLGARFGAYAIAEPIGVGGMGEVYRATDTNLKRDVAIKVLPAAFASDTERLARFQREAEVLASLNHSNIAHVYGLERSDGVTALAMELVDGPTLADRIAQRPIPVDEALGIALQIVGALEAAHTRGIVHRDLKPANVKLRPDGTVKVLDFGIARAFETRAMSGPENPSLTTPAMTRAGVVLGTAAYMAPEQARGKAVDPRADIWAFGCVLYEMLTGQAAFAGEDVTVTLARVLERGADFTALPASVSAAIRRTLQLCLQKDPKKRIADIRDVRLALEGAFETPASEISASITDGKHSGRLPWVAAFAVAALAAAVLAAPALRHWRETPPAAPPETRLDIPTPATDDPNSFALSPDGRQIVFAAAGENGAQLWLRPLAETLARPLAGTERGWLPFWSPDGHAIGFFADGALKRLDLNGGRPQTLAPATNGSGGTWNADGVILFAPTLTTPVMSIPATGGAVTAVTTLGTTLGHSSPHFLPDGRQFLFYSPTAADPAAAGIYLGTLDGGDPTHLGRADGDAAYLPSGWLVFARGGTLLAQRLDLDERVLVGEPVILADGVPVDPRNRNGLSVSATGLIAYRTGGGSQRQLVWVDRSGATLGTFGEPFSEYASTPNVSPNGRSVVWVRTVQGNRDLWQIDGVRTSRLTFDAGRDDYPILSPDGTAVAFRSSRMGRGDIFRKLIGSAAEEELVVASDQSISPTSWSADGRYLMYVSVDPESNGDLWVVPMQGDPTPAVFLKTPFRESYGVFSPDGHWVAYQSHESGRSEVYVRPFVPPGSPQPTAAAQPISTDGGTFPEWSPDGRELYYLNPAGAMMAVSITVEGGVLVPGVPEMLFPTRISRGGGDVQQGRQYDVAADGRFLIHTELDDDVGSPITVIQNWRANEDDD
jgi:Tol biopolymer transport system component